MVYEDRLGEGSLGPTKDIRVDPFVSEFDMGLGPAFIPLGAFEWFCDLLAA